MQTKSATTIFLELRQEITTETDLRHYSCQCVSLSGNESGLKWACADAMSDCAFEEDLAL